MPTPAEEASDGYGFKPASLDDSRSPCPGLNALANHGYISREGTDLTFNEVFKAICFVYNLSYPLALLLTVVGFVSCGRVSWLRPYHSLRRQPLTASVFLMSLMTFFISSWTLDLSALSARGSHKITHDASLVHPDNVPSTAPNPQLVDNLLDYASRTQNAQGNLRGGVTLVDLAQYHAQREIAAPAKLGTFHQQVALGEVALAWLVLRGSESSSKQAEYSQRIVPTERLRQWLYEERLPDGWWDSHGVRPPHAIGLLRARRVASFVKTVGADAGV